VEAARKGAKVSRPNIRRAELVEMEEAGATACRHLLHYHRTPLTNLDATLLLSRLAIAIRLTAAAGAAAAEADRGELLVPSVSRVLTRNEKYLPTPQHTTPRDATPHHARTDTIQQLLLCVGSIS
jgi:hypothetical protein